MPRTADPKNVAKKLAEVIAALVRAEVARSPKLKTAKTAATAAKSGVAPGKRRKLTLSPKALKQRKLQGLYMGLVRALPAAKKAELKKLREAKGYEAAIAAAKRSQK